MTTVALSVVLAASAATIFPGATVEVANPSGAHVVRWQEPGQGDDMHRLVLLDRKAGVARELRRFGRWAKVLWSPNGRQLAITDGVGSDGSETWLYSVAADATPIDIGAQAVARLGRATEGVHHLYVEVVRWRGNDRLELRVHGHGDGRSLDQRVEVGARR